MAGRVISPPALVNTKWRAVGAGRPRAASRRRRKPRTGLRAEGRGPAEPRMGAADRPPEGCLPPPPVAYTGVENPPAVWHVSTHAVEVDLDRARPTLGRRIPGHDRLVLRLRRSPRADRPVVAQ